MYNLEVPNKPDPTPGPDRASGLPMKRSGLPLKRSGQPTKAPDWSQRALAWAGDDLPSSVRGAQLRSVHIALLLALTFELTIYAIYRRVEAVVDLSGAFDRQALSVSDVAMPLGMGLSLLAVLLAREGRARRWSAWGAFAVMAAVALTLFPNTPNHYPILTIAFGFLALFDQRDAAEQEVALQGLRWLLVIVLFAAGVQKILYGLYFQGEFFAYRIATDATFARPFEWLMPAAELERLRSYGALAEGAGPFRTSWWPLSALANATYVIEMVLPVLLFWRRTRSVGVGLTVLFFIGMEIAPREIFFGIMAIQMTLLFGRRDWNGRLLPLWMVLFGALVVIRNLFPSFEFY